MTLIRDSKWVRLLQDGEFDEFNRQAKESVPDLRNTDLRMVDLRKADLTRADLRGAYLRNADLRGNDLSAAQMDGASLHDANVAGVLFPHALSAAEIQLSIQRGVRMRAGL